MPKWVMPCVWNVPTTTTVSILFNVYECLERVLLVTGSLVFAMHSQLMLSRGFVDNHQGLLMQASEVIVHSVDAHYDSACELMEVVHAAVSPEAVGDHTHPLVAAPKSCHCHTLG